MDLFFIIDGAVSVGEAKDAIGKRRLFSKKRIQIEHDLSQPTIKTSLFLDCGKAKQLLEWTPNVDLESGIQRTLQWYRENVLNAEGVCEKTKNF